MKVYLMLEFISGFSIGFEVTEDSNIGYLFVDLGIIRLNFNWDK